MTFLVISPLGVSKSITAQDRIGLAVVSVLCIQDRLDKLIVAAWAG